MTKYTEIIKKCLALAEKGAGHVSPNPLVGAILTDFDGNIISTGYHQKYGEAHAEVNAIKEAGAKAKDCVLFVNLEPCSHWGKTPPCADLIIKTGIKKVVIGMSDPNPKINFGGIKKLKDAGIEVIENVLKDECLRLNEIFVKNQIYNKPFVAIKTATTIDGKIATKNGDSKWITSEKSRNYVHKLRNKYDAILTSSSTVIADNPEMTCRIKNGRNPVRIVVDRDLKTDFSSKIYIENGAKVYIATDEKNSNLPDKSDNIEFIKCPVNNGKINLKYLINELYNRSVMSILVEAGGILNGSFVKEKLVDKIYHFVAPKIVGDDNAKNWISGLSPLKMSDCIELEQGKIKSFSPDFMVEYYPKYL